MIQNLRAGLLALVAVPVGIAGLSATAEAGTITLHRDATNYTGTIGGGEFGATAFSGLEIASTPMRMNGFSGIANTAFQTFCIEGGATLEQDTSMNFSVSNAINGGSNTLEAQTAYLFTKFWTGNLYSGAQSNLGGQPGGTRPASATTLQEALWYFEGFWQGSLSAGAQSLVNEANTAVASGGSWFGKGIGDVRVLNLTDAATGANLQDVLVVITAVPLPPAAFLGLALIGGLGVAGAIRRRKSIVS